ncbi:MAG: hypothetical protein EPO61_03960 [Nitrospirae bacterium]|nr:MAG: hypothetical protein EPO61_03960 [Nitrospirota bacterium]
MAQSENVKNPLPPYISLVTLKGFVQKLKETTVPDRIDGSVLTNYAGSTASQLITALRYLKLIDENSATTVLLTKLVNAYETPEWKEAMREVMVPAYKPIVKDLKLESATPGMLVERFREWGPQGEVLDKTVRFFESAMTEAGVTLSPLILNKPRARPDRSKAKAKKEKAAAEAANENEDEQAIVTPGQGAVKFSFPIPDKGMATLILPANVEEDDCEMIGQMIRIYVKRRTGK